MALSSEFSESMARVSWLVVGDGCALVSEDSASGISVVGVTCVGLIMRW